MSHKISLRANSFGNLALADRDLGWDAAAADKRRRAWASSDGSGDADKINWAKYGSGCFCSADGADDRKALGGHKLSFTDIVDGKLTAIPNGIIAATQRLGQTDIADDDKGAIQRVISRYYAKMRETFDAADLMPPWEEAQKRGLFVLTPDGRTFFNTATGLAAVPTAGAMLRQSFRTTGALLASLGKPTTGIAALQRRKADWPEGRDDAGKYLYATWRALSMTIVNSYVPVDFGAKGGVLKAALPFLIAKPFMTDHMYWMGAQIGSCQDTVWDNGSAGVPGGINALTRVNLGVRRAADEVGPLIESGDARSVSVTVTYRYKPSHDEMSDDDFYRFLGQEIEGELVRAIVTEVMDMCELSLVWDGADPYAERVAAARPVQVPAHFQLGNKPPFDTQPTPRYNPSQELNDMEQFKKALARLMGREVTEQEATDIVAGSFDLSKMESIVALTKPLTDKLAQYADTLAQRDREVAELKVKVADVEPKLALALQHEQGVRTDAKASYKLAAAGKLDVAMETMLDTLPLEQVKVLGDKFRTDADKAFPLRCQACGGTHVERAAATAKTEDKPVEGRESEVIMDLTAPTRA